MVRSCSAEERPNLFNCRRRGNMTIAQANAPISDKGQFENERVKS